MIKDDCGGVWLDWPHVITLFDDDGNEQDYIPERTCQCTTDDRAWCFACSECGKAFPRDELKYAHNAGEINYCPNCGAKVVEG